MQIAIVFSAATEIEPGRELEILADSEVLETAAAVKAALERRGHTADVVRIDPARLDALRGYDWIFNLAESVCGFPWPEYEIARRMEALGLRFTGSGSGALQACMHKARTKRQVAALGVATPAFACIAPGEAIAVALDFPLFVKPVHEDGSIGIFSDSVVCTPAELEHKVREIHRVYNQPALVEEYIEGRDITASILGNDGDALVLPLSEIVYQRDYSGPHILTYAAKWMPETRAFTGSISTSPCELSAPVRRAIEAISLRVFHATGCRDYARIDYRLRGETPYFIEVNPNPCLNPDGSGFVRSGQAGGYAYAALIDAILEQSLLRCPAGRPAVRPFERAAARREGQLGTII